MSRDASLASATVSSRANRRRYATTRRWLQSVADDASGQKPCRSVRTTEPDTPRSAWSALENATPLIPLLARARERVTHATPSQAHPATLWATCPSPSQMPWCVYPPRNTSRWSPGRGSACRRGSPIDKRRVRTDDANLCISAQIDTQTPMQRCVAQRRRAQNS